MWSGSLPRSDSTIRTLLILPFVNSLLGGHHLRKEEKCKLQALHISICFIDPIEGGGGFAYRGPEDWTKPDQKSHCAIYKIVEKNNTTEVITIRKVRLASSTGLTKGVVGATEYLVRTYLVIASTPVGGVR